MMGRTFSFNVLLFCGCLLGYGAGCAASTLELVDREVRSLFETAAPAVVKVHAERCPQPTDVRVRPLHAVGTGFFVEDTGHLLTAASVVEEADLCWIDAGGQRVNARVLGRDPVSNVALLQVDGSFPSLSFGDSDELQIGALVVVIGFPRNLPSAPMVGFVTGFDSYCGRRALPTTHLRASCRLAPGQGGGPVLNARGELVGLAVARHSDDQSSILPAKALRRIYADLKQFGEVRYAWVGLQIRDTDRQVVVAGLATNAPAALAGFREGDVVVRIGDHEVRTTADVLHAMFFHRAGERLSFTIHRGGQPVELTVTAGAR